MMFRRLSSSASSSFNSIKTSVTPRFKSPFNQTNPSQFLTNTINNRSFSIRSNRNLNLRTNSKLKGNELWKDFFIKESAEDLGPEFLTKTSGRSRSYYGSQSSNSKSGPFDSEAFSNAKFQQHYSHKNKRKHSRGSTRRGYNKRYEYNLIHLKQRERLKDGVIFFGITRTSHPSPQFKPTFLSSHPQFAPTQLSPLSALTSQHSPSTSAISTPSKCFLSSVPKLSILALNHSPSSSHDSIRLFSSSARVFSPLPPKIQVLEAGLPILIPVLAFLKSSSALQSITWISRIALTFLPFSIRAKIIHLIQERYRRDPNSSNWIKRMVESRAGVGVVLEESSLGHRVNSSLIAPGLLLLPIILLVGIIVASLEKTPITGRNRIIMISTEEEEELVENILGSNTLIDSKTGTIKRDWIKILQNVLSLEDEGKGLSGRRILLGGEVLDESDWKFKWTSAVLKALESGIPIISGEVQQDYSYESNVLEPPPSKYRLKPRCESQNTSGSKLLNAEYDLLVIDRQESNAFSFGFGPNEKLSGQATGKRGVIVVYSGFLDEILGIDSSSSLSTSTKPTSGLFTTLFSRQSNTTSEPITPPTLTQTKLLAALLSHELSHLILSHTLESYANTTLLLPQLQKMCSDIFRTLIFPFTALLGPFVNDGIGKSMNELNNCTPFVNNIINSCQSIKLEVEADLVGLRLLAAAGIDPRIALKFWENRLQVISSSSESNSNSNSNLSTTSNHLRLHSPNSSDISSTSNSNEHACGFLRTHPLNDERIKKIREELESWVEYGKSRV